MKVVVQVPPDSTQLGEKDPAPLVTLQTTVPVGIAAVGESVSLTVAVHVVGELTTNAVGAHEALTDVDRVVAVKLWAANDTA